MTMGFAITSAQLFEMCSFKEGAIDINNTLPIIQEFDGWGNHRLVYRDLISPVVGYGSFSRLEIPGVGIFMGTSECHADEFPRVFQVISSFTESVRASK